MQHGQKSKFQKALALKLQGKAVDKMTPPPPKPESSLLDVMVDGREFESLISKKFENVQLKNELQRSINEISSIRKNPVICYVANVIKPRKAPVFIEDSDDLPFNEMVSSLPPEVKEIDIVIVTPGGFAHQVAKFVNALRPRFDKVNFIILNKAMSAGTIFVLSGDELVMRNQSHIGPIDPQVRNKNGEFIPAQALLTLIDDIKDRGEKLLQEKKQPSWTDIQLLKSIDPKEIGHAISSSNYSINLVREYLSKYKFKSWTQHSKSGQPVTEEEKEARADEIANLLCSHKEWKIHGHAITREAARDICKLKITKAEDTEGLDRAMRRMWALYYWLFENTPVAKVFISLNYCLMRADKPNIPTLPPGHKE